MKKHFIWLIVIFFTFISLLFAIPLAQFQIPYFNIKEKQSYQYFIQGVNLFNNNSYKTAQKFFLKSLNIKPDFYFARRFLAESYLLAGEWENSLEEYEILKNQYPYEEYINYKIHQIENQFFLFYQINHNNNQTNYVLWKEIGLNELNLSRFIPISITRDNKFIYCLSYEPKAIFVFDLEGNLKKTIKGTLFNSIKKPSKIYIFKQNIYITDFENDQIFIFDKEKVYSKSVINNVPYPTDLFIINDILYIWSQKEKRFYKFKQNQFIGYLEIQSLDKNNLNLIEPMFINFKDSIYMLNNNIIYMIDISGYILKEIELPEKNIKSFYVNQDIIAYSTTNKIYYKTNTNNEWNIIKDLQNINNNKIEKNQFQLISSFYIDENFLYILDLSGKIYVYLNSQYKTQNISIQILNIESLQFPQIAIRLKIYDNNNKPINNLLENNFILYENDKKIPLINATNMNNYQNKKNLLILKDVNFQINDEYKELFLNQLELFFEEFKINDNIFFALTGDNINIIYNNKYKTELNHLLTENHSQNKNVDMIQNLLQSMNYLIPLKGKKAIILFTNTTQDFNDIQKIQKLQYLSFIHSIPIYIISFEKNISLEKTINKTNGKYFYFFDDYNYINIYKILENFPFYNYLITYKALIPEPEEKKLKDKYINVKIHLNYFQFGGVAEGGYIIP
ncbi:MAG: hypothetical protein KatS3mg129_0508 [Leptospiraceae bacterium]|nr:MAG: hypothetical protein KatS3mg129_0508 [Leptospiraceae bacterium]